jgi:glutathione S-transferase
MDQKAGMLGAMILHSSYTSPYVRKVKVFLGETGLWPRVREVYSNPADEAVLRPLNPLGKIPALELEDGSALFDSPVICAYLDSLHDGPRRLPDDPAAHWRVRRGEALADGLADAANLRRNEALRDPASLISRAFLDRQDLAIAQALLALDRDAARWRGEETPLLDQIAAGGAVGYIVFRYGDLDWRSRCPALAAWWDVFSARDSMTASQPTNPPGRPAPPPQSVPPVWPL